MGVSDISVELPSRNLKSEFKVMASKVLGKILLVYPMGYGKFFIELSKDLKSLKSDEKGNVFIYFQNSTAINSLKGVLDCMYANILMKQDLPPTIDISGDMRKAINSLKVSFENGNINLIEEDESCHL